MCDITCNGNMSSVAVDTFIQPTLCILQSVTFITFPPRYGGYHSLPAPPGSAVSDALPRACGCAGRVAALSSPRPARLPDLPLSEGFTGALSPNCNTSTEQE